MFKILYIQVAQQHSYVNMFHGYLLLQQICKNTATNLF